MVEAEEEMIVLSVDTVKPELPTTKQRMFLSALDIQWAGVKSVERLLFYPTNCTDFDAVVERLKSSLSSVLVHFYPLAGRLAVGEKNRPEIDCNDDGVSFVQASVGLSFDELESSEFEHRPIFRRLVPALCRQEEDNSPLLAIQVTSFEEGGICIGTSLHHIVADGNSFWHFMKSWAECCRGAPISTYPQHTRELFKLETTPSNTNNHDTAEGKSTSFDERNEGHQGKGTETQQQHSQDSTQKDNPKRPLNSKHVSKVREPDNLSNVVHRTFHVSVEMIQKLKAKSGKETFSSFITVAAHFWKCIVKAREVQEEEQLCILVLVDSRNRMDPPLPSSYFGNCIRIAFSQTPAENLLHHDIFVACGLLKNAVNQCRGKSLMSSIRFMECHEPKRKREDNGVRNGYGVHVISSPRFPVYEVDYGWGKPRNVQAASINEIGAMVVFAGREGGGTMDITTRLPVSQMEVFHSLFMAPLIVAAD